MKKSLKIVKKIAFILVISWVCVTGLLFALSFTSLPFWGLYSLSKPGSAYNFKPEYIVFMGGSGFPGKSSLLRLYFTAQLAHQYPKAKIIAAFPGQQDEKESMLYDIHKEFQMRGIDSTRFQFENTGTNTRWQALEIKKRHITESTSKIIIVSSPSHIFRAVKVFQNLGFESVGSYACFERSISMNLDFNSNEIDGKNYIPDIGANQQLRYQFWNHLKYEIVLIREYLAIFYYYLQGWI